MGDGLYELLFRVYDTADAGVTQFFEQQPGTKFIEPRLDVQGKDGLYNVILSNQGGWSLATAFGGSPRYMEVTITSVPAGSGLTPPITLTPRQQIASVPYALAARNSATESPPEWTSPASLLNNWTRYTDDTAVYSPFGYYKDASSRVYLRGVIRGGQGNADIFVLPPGDRPQYALILPYVGYPQPGNAPQSEIYPDGRLRIYREGSNAALSSLDGLSFRAE